MQPTTQPSSQPSLRPTSRPSGQPTSQPTSPTGQPTASPTILKKEIFGFVDLSSLSHYQGMTVGGKASFDASGSSVSYIGDFNGDNYDDVMVSAPNASPKGRTKAGSVSIIYGSYGHATPLEINLANRGIYPFTEIYGANAGDQCGMILNHAGDFNGDGFKDILISCYLASPNSLDQAGMVYAVYGGKNISSIDLANLSEKQGFAIYGAHSFDNLGASIAAIGDFNGDGKDDFAIGAPQASPNSKTNSGIAYLIFGKKNQKNIDLSLNSQEVLEIQGANAGDYFGFSINGEADFNNDGRADLIASASYASDNSRINSGTTYIIFGTPDHSDLNLANFNLARGIKIYGANAGDFSGYTALNAGYYHDQRKSILIAAPFASPSTDRSQAGIIHLLTNLNFTADIDMAREKGIQIYGAEANDYTGKTVKLARDVNGDGCDDIIIGLSQASYSSRNKCGKAIVVYGQQNPKSIDLKTITSSQGWVIVGANSLDFMGTSVDSAGDFNGDGKYDILFGGPGASPNSKTKSGISYINYGGYNSPTSQPTSQPSAQPILMPTSSPTSTPTTSRPSSQPSSSPTGQPTQRPTSKPTTEKHTSGKKKKKETFSETLLGAFIGVGGSGIIAYFAGNLLWEAILSLREKENRKKLLKAIYNSPKTLYQALIHTPGFLYSTAKKTPYFLYSTAKNTPHVLYSTAKKTPDFLYSTAKNTPSLIYRGILNTPKTLGKLFYTKNNAVGNDEEQPAESNHISDNAERGELIASEDQEIQDQQRRESIKVRITGHRILQDQKFGNNWKSGNDSEDDISSEEFRKVTGYISDDSDSSLSESDDDGKTKADLLIFPELVDA